MDVTAAKYIGAGLAMLGMIGAGIGLGILFGNYLSSAIRNPSATICPARRATPPRRPASARCCSWAWR